jgi:hypothetical protein
MDHAELVSHITLWIVVLLLVFAYMQLPQPWKRKNRLDLQDFGLPLRQPMPELDIRSITGESIMDLIRPGVSTVLLFTSVGCQACNGLYPLLNTYAEREDVNFLLFVEGDETAIKNKTREHKFTFPVFQLNDDLMTRLQVSAFPFGYYVTGTGLIAAKGGIPDADALELLLSEGFYENASLLKTG